MNLIETVLALAVLSLAIALGWNADVTAMKGFMRADAMQTAAMAGEDALNVTLSELVLKGTVPAVGDYTSKAAAARVNAQQLEPGLWEVTAIVYQANDAQQQLLAFHTLQAVAKTQ